MRSINYLFILAVFFCFCFLCPSNIFAQTTVNFSLVILPAPELKQEIIPEIVEKIEEEEVEEKSFVETIKQEEPSKDNNQQRSGFGMLLQETPNINQIVETISNDDSEKQTQEVTHFAIYSFLYLENIRAGPS